MPYAESLVSPPPDLAFGAGPEPAALDSWCESFQGSSEQAGLFRAAHGSDLPAVPLSGEGPITLPEVGADFLGFRLVTELGRGAFGRVFLARQSELADRLVALKVSTEILVEPQRLARLQHTNIVPLYSVHRAGSLQAVCMPYFGAATLADVLHDMTRREALPASSRELLSTVNERKVRTRAALDSTRRPPSEASSPNESLPPPPPAEAVSLRALEGLSHIEAVLWIGARLADGLAHAHERGILHRDLKPANVLLTDDGQPMLLDFNLSEDVQARPGTAAAMIGGTLPYMAPEHLEAFGGQPRVVDARADIYSLGIILYELLTGRPPFGRPPGPAEVVLPLMLAERCQGAPRLRRWNRAISPAAEAIVRRCLDPHPARRYQNARQLQEDLDRQLKHEPLRHTPEPSLRERLAKWRRRHPRLTSSGAVAAAAAVAVAALATLLVLRGQRVARLEAAEERAGFTKDLDMSRVLLSAGGGDEGEGRATARKALDRYGVLDGPGWRERPAYRNLPEAERTRLDGELGEVALLLAGGTAARRDGLSEALRLNRLAEQCYGEGRSPRALWEQRARLSERLGLKQEARLYRIQAGRTPVRDGWDYYLLGQEQKQRGHVREALDELKEAVRRDPRNTAAQFLMAVCCRDMGRDAEALSHLTTCVALRPGSFAARYNRGLALLRQREYREAEEEFTSALELRPGRPAVLIQRALAREGQKKYAEARADLDRALKMEGVSTGIWFHRARLRRMLGDAAGARRDREEGLRRRPTDEEGWVARGVARAAADPKGALADFVEAVKLNPRSLIGLHHQAQILSERLDRPRDAVALLDRGLARYPDVVALLGGRGTLRARLGMREAAHDDAGEALIRDRSGRTLFQAAGIYALTSPGHVADRDRALELLAQALQLGFGFDLLETDPDLAPLRGSKAFRNLVEAARTVRAKGKK